MKTDLANMTCRACAGGEAALEREDLDRLLEELGEGWEIVDGTHHLEKTYKWKDFQEALGFTNLVGEIAERENHHPDILLSWGQVKLLLRTHKIDGLTESDFILAAKADQAHRDLTSGM